MRPLLHDSIRLAAGTRDSTGKGGRRSSAAASPHHFSVHRRLNPRPGTPHLPPIIARTLAPSLDLASHREISAFLADVERRAFKQAMFAVRDEDAALDIVQDAMLRLAEKYGNRPAAELPLLFHRIVQNAIRDCGFLRNDSAA